MYSKVYVYGLDGYDVVRYTVVGTDVDMRRLLYEARRLHDNYLAEKVYCVRGCEELTDAYRERNKSMENKVEFKVYLEQTGVCLV